jgi:hypothetical protein
VNRASVSGLLAFVLVSLAAQSAGIAHGATYDVHACRLPNGAPAPALGWTGTGPSSPGATLSLNCPGGTMSGRAAAGTHPRGALHGFSFLAPAGTTIAGFDSASEGVVPTINIGPPPWDWNYGAFGTEAGSGRSVDVSIQCGNCGPFTAAWDHPFSGFRLSQFVLGLQCDPYRPNPCSENGAHFIIRRVALHLEDKTPPQVLASSGTMLGGAGSLSGERNLTLTLRDVGGGLLKARVEADGKKLTERPIDDSRGTCKPPFVAPVPCSTAATVDLPIDTRQLSDGTHLISVRVFDATGVNSALYGPISVVTDNFAEPVTPGRISCPARGAITVTRRLRRSVVRFGSANWLSGRVAGPRAVIRGSSVALLNASNLRMPVPAARISRHGRFVLRLRPVSQGKVRPVILSSTEQPQACGQRVSVRVRAGLRFDVAPKRLRNGQSIVMRGRLRALPVPAAGKTVAIQARARGGSGWTTVTLLRSDPRGRFKYRYQFRRTFRQTTYEFRAVAPRERRYPYLRGWSPVRHAVVMP